MNIETLRKYSVHRISVKYYSNALKILFCSVSCGALLKAKFTNAAATKIHTYARPIFRSQLNIE